MSNVLYLEDTPDQRDLVTLVLSTAGIDIDTAVDGEEGLRKVQENRPSLILLDLGMPKIDGFEFMERLKAQPETSQIPVIVVSAWTSKNHRERAIEAGATMFISKPYDLESLTDTVRKFLSPK